MEREPVLPLRQALERARDGIWRCQSEEEVQRWCRWIMARLVAEGKRIEKHDRLVGRRHRRWKSQMDQACWMVSHPTGSVGALLCFLKAFGKLVVEAQERLLASPSL